ncbi:phage tail protein [Immundisolibacter sp.]
MYKNKLVVVAVWAQGEIDGYEQVYMDDAALPSAVTATHYHGTQAQTPNATLVAAYAAAGITYTDALPGVAYSVFQVPTSDGNGFPSFAATIRGRKVYDPRTGITGYSDNPSLCLADFIASDVYGWGKSVDWATVADAANANDELVGSVKRRRVGLVLDSVQTCASWIDVLRTYAGCFVTHGGNGYQLISNRPAATFKSITASNIVKDSLKITKRGARNDPTVVIVKYTDTTIIPWREKTVSAYAPGVLDGLTPRRESEISLPGIQDRSQAYREAVERLNHFLLEDLHCELTVFDEGLAVEPADVIEVTHPIGLTEKKFRVEASTSDSPGRWKLKLREYDPAAYSDAVVYTPTYADTQLPSPTSPPPVTGLAATEEVFQMLNGTWSSRIRLTWDDPGYVYITEFRIEIYSGSQLIHTGTSLTPTYASPAIQEGETYSCFVALVTSLGASSEWAQKNLTAQGKQLIPSDVPSVSVFEVGGQVFVSWAPAIDVDIWRYEVRYDTAAGGSWENGKLIDRVDALRLTTSQIAVGTWRIYVKAVDSIGQYSANAAYADVIVTSDSNAFFVDAFDQTAPVLTNMASFTLAPTDLSTYYVTEDNVAFGTKYSSALSTYGNVLATYHNSVTSTWLGEGDDWGQVLSGQWTGEATVEALSGSLTSYLGLSNNGSTWSYMTGLSHKDTGRFARLKHEALTTGTLKVTAPTQRIRLDAIPREETGFGTSSSTAATTIMLDNDYVSVKKITVTPVGSTPLIGIVDNITMGDPSSFDVYIFDDDGAQVASDFYYSFQGI